jgi:hypothetical protein
MKLTGLYPTVLAIILFTGCANETNDSSTDESAGTSRVDSILDGASKGAPAMAGSAAADGSVKLNPPHGEPGHRCEIAVGAPLDSKPSGGAEPQLTITPQTPGAVQPQLNTQPQMNIQPQPAKAPTESPEAMLAKGLNPPHGAPGHDCAIPVGQPLKK